MTADDFAVAFRESIVEKDFAAAREEAHEWLMIVARFSRLADNNKEENTFRDRQKIQNLASEVDHFRKLYLRHKYYMIYKIKDWLIRGRLSDDPVSFGKIVRSTAHEAAFMWSYWTMYEIVKIAGLKPLNEVPYNYFNILSHPTTKDITPIIIANHEAVFAKIDTTCSDGSLVSLVDTAWAAVESESIKGLAAWKATMIETADLTDSKTNSTLPVICEANRKAIEAAVRSVYADVERGVIVVDGVEHEADAHHCKIVKALVDANGLNVTGPEINNLPGCHGKKISREIANLEKHIPALKKYLKHDGNKGYRISQ